MRFRPLLFLLSSALAFTALLGARTLSAAFGDAALIADPQYAFQWPLDNTGQEFPEGCTSGVDCLTGTPDADIDWAEAHDLGFTGQGVVVAIGSIASPGGAPTVKCLNPELVDRLWQDPNDPSVHGWNFATNSSDVCIMQSGTNHDTDVAKLAVASINGIQLAGVAPGARLMVLVSVLGPDPVTNDYVLYDQVLPWLANRGVRVLFIPYTSVTPPTSCNSYGNNHSRRAKLISSGVLVIWGCPNSYPGCDANAVALRGTRADDTPFYDDPNGINCSQDSPYQDLAVPAGRGYTGGPTYGLSYAIGTLAGAAALLLEEDPGQSRQSLQDRLEMTADEVGAFPYVSGHNEQYGFGRVNVFDALMVGDVDGDGIPGDGDGSWLAGDAPCSGGGTSSCDDNCPLVSNPSQADPSGVGPGSGPDGIGSACQCGDVDGDGAVLTADENLVQGFLAGTAALPSPDRCNVHGAPGGDPTRCELDDWAVLKRAIAGLSPAPAQICGPALP